MSSQYEREGGGGGGGPCIAHEAHVSPGCTRAETQIARRRASSSGRDLKLVTVSSGHGFPASELPGARGVSN